MGYLCKNAVLTANYNFKPKKNNNNEKVFSNCNDRCNINFLRWR